MDDRDELSAIDRALAEALDVDVSPDFAARVRRRIADEPMRAPFWRGWRGVVPAAAAVAIAVVGVIMLSTRGPSTPPFLASRSLASGHMTPADVRPAPVLLAADRPASSSGVRAGSVLATATQEPEVLVPREEIDMYRRLIAQAQTVPHAVVVDAPKNLVPVGLFSEITIDPIKIELIVPPVGGEGERK
jgi:hypothetical protein